MRLIAALALLSSGCGPDPLDVACGGTRPAIETCTAHLYDADCGGAVGAPTFACGSGRCRWFAGACIAAGYVVSDCPPSERCCHTASWGPWAFEDDFQPASGVEVAVAGDMPLDSTVAGNLVVTIDPDVVVPAEPSCTGAHYFGDLCSGRGFSQIRFRTDRVTEGVALEWWPNILGVDLMVEAYRNDDGALVGRVFARVHSDVGGTAQVCSDLDPAPGLHGELVIDALSEEGPIAAVLYLETDGATMTIPF